MYSTQDFIQTIHNLHDIFKPPHTSCDCECDCCTEVHVYTTPNAFYPKGTYVDVHQTIYRLTGNKRVLPEYSDTVNNSHVHYAVLGTPILHMPEDTSWEHMWLLTELINAVNTNNTAFIHTTIPAWLEAHAPKRD